MEITMAERSFVNSLRIKLQDNLPAVIVIGFSLLVALVIAIETGPDWHWCLG
jgi:hypothetical protein